MCCLFPPPCPHTALTTLCSPGLSRVFLLTRMGVHLLRARETPRAHQDRILPSGPTPSRGSRHTGTVTRIPGSVDQQAPGVLRSWPWGAQGEVPKDQQNGVLCPPEPDSSCANSFCSAHVGLSAPFVLHSLVWLQPSLRASSRPACSPLSFGSPGLMPQTTELRPSQTPELYQTDHERK